MSRTRGTYKVDRTVPAIITNPGALAELHEQGRTVRVDAGAFSVDVSPAAAGRWTVHSRTVPARRLHNLTALHLLKRGAV